MEEPTTKPDHLPELPTLTGEQRRAKTRKVHREIAKRWPDAYGIAGIGWCGPGWKDAQLYEEAHLPKPR